MISVILMVSDITIILIFNQKPLIIHFFHCMVYANNLEAHKF